MQSITRVLNDGWTFTQAGGGQETGDGEWLKTSTFPTSVHVELLRLMKIPDPVSSASCTSCFQCNGMYLYVIVPWTP